MIIRREILKLEKTNKALLISFLAELKNDNILLSFLFK